MIKILFKIVGGIGVLSLAVFIYQINSIRKAIELEKEPVAAEAVDSKTIPDRKLASIEPKPKINSDQPEVKKPRYDFEILSMGEEPESRDADNRFLSSAKLLKHYQLRSRKTGGIKDVRIFEKKGQKYEFIRVEAQYIFGANGEKKSGPQNLMAADHVIVVLNSDKTVDDLESVLGEVDAEIQSMPKRANFYLVGFNGIEEGVFESVISELKRRKDIIASVDPDYMMSP